MAKWVKNNSGADKSWTGQLVADGAYYQIQLTEDLRWKTDDDVMADIGSGDLIVARDDSGTTDLGVAEGIAHLMDASDEPQDIDGRRIGHTTPRQYGTVTYFTGAGDDDANEYAVGGAGGVPLTWHHETAQPTTQTIIADLNTIENTSYLHAGILQWKDALNDEVTCEVIPKTTSYSSGTGFDYTLYGGYLIVPTAPGAGDVDVAAVDRVLVEVPLNEAGIRLGAGYFDATWNKTTKVWENFAPNYTGTGQFNMFAVAVVLDRFANRLAVLGDGMSPLETHDASMFGHNNRAKFTYKTMGTDHEWWGNCWLVFHRKRTA